MIGMTREDSPRTPAGVLAWGPRAGGAPRSGRPLKIVLALADPPMPLGSAPARWSSCLLRGLVERGHEVTCLAAFADEAEAAAAHELYPAGDFTLRTFPHRRGKNLVAKGATLLAPRSHLTSPEYRRALAEAAAGADVVHVEVTWTAYCLPAHLRPKAVLGVHWLAAVDLANAGPAGLRAGLLRASMLRQERRLLRSVPRLAVLTPELARRVQRIAPRSEVSVVPLGINPQFYPYDGADPAGPPTLGIIGRISWGPTRDAAERLVTRLWPAIRRRRARGAAAPGGPRGGAARGPRPGGGAGGEAGRGRAGCPAVFPRALHAMLYAPGPRGHRRKGQGPRIPPAGQPRSSPTPPGPRGSGPETATAWPSPRPTRGWSRRAVAFLTDPALRGRSRAAGRELALRVSDPAASLDRLEDVYEAAAVPPRG